MLCRVPLLVLTFLLAAGGVSYASTAAPGDTASSVTLFADFSADVPGTAPDLALPAPPTGDALTIQETSGVVRVDASIDGLTMAAQLKQQGGAGGVKLIGWPASPPPGTERISFGWRSVAQDDNPLNIVACVVRGSNGGVIASVEYRPHGALTWNAIAGAERLLPVTYQQNRNLAFRIDVDLLSSTVSLSVDGVPVPGFQGVPFAQPATDATSLAFEAGGTSPQTFAVDDLYAVALARDPDRFPAVVAPASVAVEELGHVDVPVTASDPDGDALTLTADLTALPAGHTATFTANATNTAGTFSWTPGLGQAGVYPVTFTATAMGVSSSAVTNVFVASLGTAVTGRFIWTPQPGQEGTYIVTFIATDLGGTTTLEVPITVLPDGTLLRSEPSARTAASPEGLAPQAPMKGPIISYSGSTSTKTGETLTLTTTATTDNTALASRFSRAGSTGSRAAEGLITLTADLSGLPTGNDAVFVVDQDPIVTAPATVQAEAGVPLTVQVGADDPDADPIANLTVDLTGLPAGHDATFSTNAAKSLGTLTWTPSPSDSGNYSVTFTATNRLVGTASTVIQVRHAVTARVFSVVRKLNLGSGKPTYPVSIEPAGGSFDLADVDPFSIVMISEGTGSVSQIRTAVKPDPVIGDRDRNLAADLTVAFAKTDLRQLFSLLRGNVVVDVVIRGALFSGGHFQGILSVSVNAGTGSLAAAVSPNPLNPHATLRFMTARPGQVTARLHDAAGRLVRVLLPRAFLAAGEHEIAIRGEDASGRRLASGVYFYRIESEEGTSVGRMAIVK